MTRTFLPLSRCLQIHQVVKREQQHSTVQWNGAPSSGPERAEKAHVNCTNKWFKAPKAPGLLSLDSGLVAVVMPIFATSTKRREGLRLTGELVQHRNAVTPQLPSVGVSKVVVKEAGPAFTTAGSTLGG